MKSDKGVPSNPIQHVFARPLETLLIMLGLVFIYALWMGILSLVYVIFTFAVVVLIDYRDYLEVPGTPSNFTMAAGAALIVMGLFLDSVLNRTTGFHADEGFGSADFIPVILGLLIFLYGFGSLRQFFIPLAISFSFLAITVIPNTSWGEHIHEPFITFTVEGSMRLIELTEYTAHSNGADITMVKENSRETVTVDRGCSGFESTTYFAIFGSFLLWKLEGERRKKLFIIAIGLMGLLLINILRITLLILLYFWFDMEVLETAHTNLGNILFFIWVGFIWWVSFTYLLPPLEGQEGYGGQDDQEGLGGREDLEGRKDREDRNGGGDHGPRYGPGDGGSGPWEGQAGSVGAIVDNRGGTGVAGDDPDGNCCGYGIVNDQIDDSLDTSDDP